MDWLEHVPRAVGVNDLMITVQIPRKAPPAPLPFAPLPPLPLESSPLACRADVQKDLTRNELCFCHCLEILNHLRTRDLHFHFGLGRSNYVTNPAFTYPRAVIPLRALAQPSATLLLACLSCLRVHSPPLLTLTPAPLLLPSPAPSLSLLSQQQDTPPSQRQ